MSEYSPQSIEEYAAIFSGEIGAPAKTFRMALGALNQFAIRNDAPGLATATLTQLRFVTGI
ncbi:MAG: hypothetical protein ACYTXC_15340 [Nostoc sp.]